MRERSIGGVAAVEDMVVAFMGLLEKHASPELVNGAICRITLRGGGKRVVQDIMQYGKEQGGGETPRAGLLLASL